MEHGSGEQQGHPAPTVWPIGFAIGVACALLGLVVSWVIFGIGAAIAAIFGYLWIRDLTRSKEDAGAGGGEAEAPAAVEVLDADGVSRTKFLGGATLGLGAVIGGIVTVPPVGMLISSSFFNHPFKDIDVGPISDFPEGKYVITTFVSDPAAGEVSRRTTFIRNNGFLQGKPSFTIISNRCVHLGCPVQPNGPVDRAAYTKEEDEQGAVILEKLPVTAAGFGCPCHGGAYDTEGNRTAGPPVRALDRYQYAIKRSRLVLLEPYSVGTVDGEGKDAVIKKYPIHYPGQHVDGPEFWLWPIPEIHT